ncbi:MAG: glycosyltransferase family 39 protein [Deltaproteobacteria bacterium]|nr:glycosyltransferase family 39 protein [Deltaproteobacteria bacterium]
MQSRSAVSLVLALTALSAVGAVLWIAFAHSIPLPFVDVPGPHAEIHGLAGPLLVLIATGVLWAAHERQALREALGRAISGTATSSDERVARLIVLALVVTGFLLRLARAGEYGLNPDEAQLVWVGAPETLAGVWKYERISPHPPAIFLVLHYMLKFSWNLVWLRLPSIVSGAFLIWISYRFARELFGTPAGVAMAWLVAFAPAIFELGRVARNYVPGFALIVLALFFFVRFLKAGRWRDFAWYSLFAPLAVTWHYVFLLGFAAMKIVLAVEFLRHRRPFSWWLRAGALQLPFAALMVFLYLQHIAKMPDMLVNFHLNVYDWMLEYDANRPFRSIEQIWRLLAPGGTQWILFLFSSLGVGLLAVNRNWLALLVCVVPVLVAQGFSWAGKVPFGMTRHSVYVFPFLFGLVVCHVPEILTGYRSTRENLQKLFARWNLDVRIPGVGRAPSLAGPALGVAAACAVGALFMFSSLLDSNDEKQRNPFFQGSYHGTELIRHYRQADVERAFELLEQYAGPNDWVLLDFVGAYMLRMHLQEPPNIYPSDDEREARDIRMPALEDRRPQRRKHNGVQYFFAKGTPLIHATDAMEMLRDVRANFDLRSPDKVWMLRSAWSGQLMRPFEDPGMSIRVDRRANRESGGILFGIETRELRALTRQHEDDGQSRRYGERWKPEKP